MCAQCIECNSFVGIDIWFCWPVVVAAPTCIALTVRCHICVILVDRATHAMPPERAATSRTCFRGIPTWPWRPPTATLSQSIRQSQCHTKEVENSMENNFFSFWYLLLYRQCPETIAEGLDSQCRAGWSSWDSDQLFSRRSLCSDLTWTL